MFGGVLAEKDSVRVCAIGEVDELNALLGVCRSFSQDEFIDTVLLELQNGLFDLGAFLASLGAVKGKNGISADSVTLLERRIDEVDAGLKELKNFILPCGGKVASHLHLARAVCRRAERTLCKLYKNEFDENAGGHELAYLNRMSDLLFVMARLSNAQSDVKDVIWKA